MDDGKKGSKTDQGTGKGSDSKSRKTIAGSGAGSGGKTMADSGSGRKTMADTGSGRKTMAGSGSGRKTVADTEAGAPRKTFAKPSHAPEPSPVPVKGRKSSHPNAYKRRSLSVTSIARHAQRAESIERPPNKRKSSGSSNMSLNATPFVDLAGAATSALRTSEKDVLSKANKQAEKGGTSGLTPLPTRAVFEGGLAVAPGPGKAQKRRPSATATPAGAPPDKSTYEVKMERVRTRRAAKATAKGMMSAPPSSYKVQINPRTLGSLVDALRQIFGTNFANAAKRYKKAKPRVFGEFEGPDGDDKADDEYDLDDIAAEQLETKLYGDQVGAMDEFLAARRECETELVFEETSFPRWVSYLWKVHLIYEFLSSCLLIISVFFGTYAAIFRNHAEDIQLLGIISCTVAIDVIIRLLVELWRSFTKCQYEVFTVKYTFFLAIMDFIALFPYTQFHMFELWRTARPMSFTDVNYIGFGESIKTFHLFRMSKILVILMDDMNIRGPAKFAIAMTRYVIQYLLTVHLLACVLFYIGGRTYFDLLLNRNPESLSDKEFVMFLSIRKRLVEPPPRFYLPYPEPLGLYQLSTYLVVQTISTVGFGDFFATNNSERILVIIMMLIGSIWISGELAYQLGTFFSDLDASRYMMFFRMNCIRIHLQNYQVSNFICTRTQNYYRHLWRYRKGVHEIDLSYLPHCVQEEIKFDICEEMFYKSPMFRGLDETFLMGLAKKAKVSLYSPRMILFERGSITKQMCFILQGECAVAAGLDDDEISAIHRAGCLIGEINLFMAIPYEQCIYTRTVCTIMTISKKDLMLALQDYPHVFSIMRDRMRKRRERYRNAFKLVQTHPYVQWIHPTSPDSLKANPEFPIRITKMRGFNRPVSSKQCPLKHEDEQVIIEMPCTRPDLSRVESHTYRLISVPQIYYDSSFWLTLYNTCMMMVWFYQSLLTPACATFDDFKDTYFGTCNFISGYWYIIVLISAADFVVELLMACPSTGIVYKIKDGIEIKKSSIEFYFDLLSIVPYELVLYSWSSSLFRMFLKQLKIGRMWDFLDERFPLKLFYVRIAKMTYNLLYLTYVIALFYLNLVCEPGRLKPCNDISFYNPIFPTTRLQRIKDGENFEQFILTTPIALATSAITSVGFGNIFPQTGKEIMWTTIFMIIGHFFVSYILAQLTSALSARLTPKLIFHQKLVVVQTFVRHNGLSSKLSRKLVEHYDLQHQYVSGCSLPQSTHLMYDGHKVLLEDLFLVEGELFFDGVPAFAKIPSQAIIDMSRLMKRFVVPPDLVFVQRGEVRRCLYIIVNGSVALYQHGEKTASAILTSTGHFGQRDLLFGEPYAYKVKTLSYVTLYAVDYNVFHKVLGDDEGLMEYIKDEISRREDEIKTYMYANIIDEDGPSRRGVFPPSWIRYPPEPDAPLLGADLTYDHFEKPFLYYRGSNFIRENTMSDILHPAGKFGKRWQVIMGLAAVATLLTLIFETFIGYRAPPFRYFQIGLDLLFIADVYMKFHWAYYRAGEMRYHPVKTWIRYLFHGTFFIDVAMCIPLELIVSFSGSVDLFGYGLGHMWYTKLRWIRFFRCYKFIELYNIVHRIFENRTAIMFVFYLSICVIVGVILASFALFSACPTLGYQWEEGDEYKLPVCLTGSWPDHKAEEKILLRKRHILDRLGLAPWSLTEEKVFYARGFFDRIFLGLYYVGQVLMVIGFGDLATFQRSELHFLTTVALFGFIVCQAIISDITSAQIDTDEVRAQNREKLERLSIALSREKSLPSFSKYVEMAFRLSWSYAKGLQPNELFNDLHPVLHRELLDEYIGDVFDRVPIILGFTDAFVNALKSKLKIEFYPKGGMVTLADDLEYRMYVVVKGNIWVTDRDHRWICTMGVGESIGEMSLVYSAKRRFNAYAATNLQLLVLSAIDFAAVLDYFPLTRREIIKSLINYKRESYIVKAWKWKSRDPEGYLKEQEENTKLLPKIALRKFVRIPVGGNVKLHKNQECPDEPHFLSTLVGYGSSEIIMHYIYFASDDERFNPVIHPGCKFMTHFGIMVQAASFFGSMIALFHVTFYVDPFVDQEVTDWTTNLSSFFDIILWIRIVLNFFTAVEISERKTYCKEWKKIVIHYLFGPQRFLFDVLVAFPYDRVTGKQESKYLAVRCLLAVKFFSEIFKTRDDIGTSTLRLKLFTSLSFLLYLAHILACLFFWISCGKFRNGQGLNGCSESGWVAKFRIEFGKMFGDKANTLPYPPVRPYDLQYPYNDDRPSHWYVISLYWVTAVVTTCGFGDITPTNFHEVMMAVFIIFFGSLFLSILLGNITTGLSSLNEAKRQYCGSVEKMLDYLQVIGLSSVGHQTLSAYCNMTWNNCRGVNYNDIAAILPLYVQQDVYLALYHKSVTNCLFFGRDYDLAFCRAVCSRLRHYMFLPGMRIANELEPGSGIYLIKSGAVTSFQQNPENGTHEFIKRYEQYQVFGRIPALYPGALYNKSYRAEEKTEVLLMYHSDIRQLIMKYPRWRIFLKQLIAKEYHYFGKSTSLRNITETRISMDERLTKNLTYEQFSEAANMFASQPPVRTGNVNDNEKEAIRRQREKEIMAARASTIQSPDINSAEFVAMMRNRSASVASSGKKMTRMLQHAGIRNMSRLSQGSEVENLLQEAFQKSILEHGRKTKPNMSISQDIIRKSKSTGTAAKKLK